MMTFPENPFVLDMCERLQQTSINVTAHRQQALISPE